VRVEDGALKMRITLVSAKANPLAEQVLQLMREGALKSVSVGFRPGKRTTVKRGDREVRELSENKLLELSIVAIGANPDAHAKDHGTMTKAEAIVAASAADRSLLVETLSTLFSASGTSTLKEAMGWIDAAAFIVEASRDANITKAVDAGIAARRLNKNQRETFIELGRSIGEAKLRATIATLETRESASVARLLDDASVRGLIPPAQRATWEAAAEKLGADWLKSAVDGMAPLIKPSASPDIAPADTSPDGAALVIDDELRAELARLGLSEKDYTTMRRATKGAQ
jgi:hypothetical protein